MMKNHCLEAVAAELDRHGVAFWVEHGGKHLKVRWERDGKKQMYVLGITPSDWRAPLQARAIVRRMLRQA